MILWLAVTVYESPLKPEQGPKRRLLETSWLISDDDGKRPRAHMTVVRSSLCASRKQKNQELLRWSEEHFPNVHAAIESSFADGEKKGVSDADKLLCMALEEGDCRCFVDGQAFAPLLFPRFSGLVRGTVCDMQSLRAFCKKPNDLPSFARAAERAAHARADFLELF